MSPRKRSCPEAEVIRNLLRVFSPILSPRQRTCLAAHHHEGKNLSAIARELGISRQAVLDTVRHGERHLLKLAKCLSDAGITLKGQSHLAMPMPKAVLQRLGDLRERVAREGIIYSPRWIVEELEKIESSITRLDDPEESSSFGNR